MQNLKKQKLKLSIFFSLLVFLLAIFLELVFFNFKYFNEKKLDKNIFIKQTKILIKKTDKQNDILYLFEDTFLDDKLWQTRNLKNNFWKINFIILNKNNEIVDKKILENLDFSKYNNLDNSKIYFINNFFILKKNLKNHILWNKIIIYKKINYNISFLFKDISLFIFITFIFSILFFIIWKKFVDKNFKPVEQNIKDMENFIQNSSHEFKTPLAIINSNLQIIKIEKKYDEILILESIKTLDNFNNLINTLTQLSWIKLNIKDNTTNYKKEIPEIVAENLSKIKAKNIQLFYKIKTNKNNKFFWNKEHFKILFQNLLQNAIKYNKKWWKIKILLENNKLIIEDTWIWINKKNLSKIFNRFYREKNSKTWESFGIWLSLVAKIWEINDRKIIAESKKWKWTKFIVKF